MNLNKTYTVSFLIGYFIFFHPLFMARDYSFIHGLGHGIMGIILAIIVGMVGGKND